MIRRLGQCVMPMLIALDLLACTTWLTLLYPMGLADRPTGRELISGYVGRAALNGHPWGKRMARLIDQVALWLGDEPDHCARIYQFYHRLEV
jgi:hypothetical protein